LIKKDWGQVVFTKSVHLDVLLDDMQGVGKVQFEKLEMERLKGGTRIIMADWTIIVCEPNLNLTTI
jgi:hypothetical protein